MERYIEQRLMARNERLRLDPEFDRVYGYRDPTEDKEGLSIGDNQGRP